MKMCVPNVQELSGDVGRKNGRIEPHAASVRGVWRFCERTRRLIDGEDGDVTGAVIGDEEKLAGRVDGESEGIQSFVERRARNGSQRARAGIQYKSRDHVSRLVGCVNELGRALGRKRTGAEKCNEANKQDSDKRMFGK